MKESKTHWKKWSGSIVPSKIRKLAGENPALVAYTSREGNQSRLVVRLEWPDGALWVVKADNAPWFVHADDDKAFEAWADGICDTLRDDWGHYAKSEERRVA